MTSRLLVDKIEGKTTSGSIQMPSGHIIQTVHNIDRNQSNVNSSSYTELNTGMRTSITPRFSTSKIWITATLGLAMYENSGSTVEAWGQIYDVTNSTALTSGESKSRFSDYGGSGIFGTNCLVMNLEVSPSTTATQTYTWRIKLTDGVYCSVNNDSTSTAITLMEIAG